MTGAIVLAGGRSERMGCAKAELDWHGVPLLVHVCAVVRRGVAGGPVVVVRSPGQRLPALPAWVELTEDAATGVGPMQGLLDGLRALPDGIERVFLATTDAPLLCPAYPAALLEALALEPSRDALIPFVRGHRHPLLAAYRASASTVERLASGLARGERRAGQIFADTLRLVHEEELRAMPGLVRQDPALLAVEDVDTPEQYAGALGRPLPEVVVERPGSRRRLGAVRLGQLADVMGLDLSAAAVAIGGRPVSADVLTPLAAGDVVSIA